MAHLFVGMSRILTYLFLALPAAHGLMMQPIARAPARARPAAMLVPELATSLDIGPVLDAPSLPTVAALADNALSAFDVTGLSSKDQAIVLTVYGVVAAGSVFAVRFLFGLLVQVAKLGLQVGIVVALFDFFGIVPPP